MGTLVTAYFARMAALLPNTPVPVLEITRNAAGADG